MNSSEVWRDIQGFEKYQISNCGRVRSFIQNRNHVISFATTPKGYLYVRLFKDNKRYNKRVHRLVAEAFVENSKNLESINHINEVKTDNHVDNLEWCTVAYNNNYGNRNRKAGLANSKPVVMMDLNGNVVKRFESARDAEKQNYGTFQGISNCCRSTIPTHKGYKWSFI